MRILNRSRLTREVALRIAADVIMVNAAVVVALAARFVYEVYELEGPGAAAQFHQILRDYAVAYGRSALLITAACLLVFYFCGFYTYGRLYLGRYKVLLVAQAVTLAYLLFAILAYAFGGGLKPSRAAWALAWLVTACMLVAAREWSLLWRNVVRAERRLIRPSERRRVRKVLVIGGAGYIGSALVPKLLNRGYHVRVLDLLLYGSKPLQGVLNHPHLEVVRADFRHVDKVVKATCDMDAVIHMGAIVGDPACALDRELTIEVNLTATRMIAEVAEGSDVGRFVFASTCSAYGASDEVLNERSRLNPVSLYAQSKVAAEEVLLGLSSASFAPTCLRFATIYGFSGRIRFDLVVNLLTAKAIRDGLITVYDGDQWRPFLHVDDAAHALLRTLEAPLDAVRDQIFNVGSNEQNYTIQQVGEMINRLVPSARLLNMGSGADRRNYRVDCRKIHDTLGFAPRWTLTQGIQQVIHAIHSGGVEDYESPQYHNVKCLGEAGPSRICCVNGWADELIRERSAGLSWATPPTVLKPEAATST